MTLLIGGIEMQCKGGALSFKSIFSSRVPLLTGDGLSSEASYSCPGIHGRPQEIMFGEGRMFVGGKIC